jgi:hypothetical protein
MPRDRESLYEQLTILLEKLLSSKLSSEEDNRT